MIDSTTFTQDMLSHPTKMMSAVINAMEASDSGSSFTVNDPNNGFVMQLASSLAIFSKFSEKVDYTTGFYYSKRARNAEQLYAHLSEFDYVDLMASPATLPFIFRMSRDWIVENAQYYDANYNKIEIPATSYFTMGNIVYSMYYPIEILVNRNTGAVTAFYDTSKSNNLNTLSSNLLLDEQSFTKDGVNYFQISFNMYQFEREVTSDAVASQQGYIRTLTYSDQFYAVKIYTLNNKVWNELDYSLSSLFYDYQKPTAILSLLTNTSQIKIEIPQIYFDTGQISQTIRIELYTTKGKVNYAIYPPDVAGLVANFDTKSSQYAAPLAQMPTWNIVPSVTEVAGGSNVKPYNEIRDDIVNQRLYNRTAVTLQEVTEAGKRAGFDITRVVDDLTERIYLVSNVLVDANNIVLPVFAGNILIANESLTGNPSTIIDFSDGYYTILPTTTFTIASNSLTCTPMTDSDVAVMAQMTNADMVAELNTGRYVRQPFHITLQTAAKSPKALIYNLLYPTMTSLKFIAENAHSAPQMSVTACEVNHLNNGTGGYEVLLGVTRSAIIDKADVSNFSVVMTSITKSGRFVYLPATYVSTTDYGLDIWRIVLATSYHITTDDHITLMMYNNDNVLVASEISLNSDFTIVTSFVKTFDSSIPSDSKLNALLPESYQTSHVTMSQQLLSLSLGSNLSQQIFCGVNTSWGNDVYKTADATIYHTTNDPIFQTNEVGVINTRVNSQTNNLEVVQLYSQGTTPSTTQDLMYATTLLTNVPSGSAPMAMAVESTDGILVGMAVRATGIAPGTIVSGIQANAVTLSKKITQVVAKGTVLTFTNPSLLLRTSVAQSGPSRQVTVASTVGMLVGQSVFGFDIPAGNTISSINSATQFTLATATTAALGNHTLLTVINTTAPGVVKIRRGDVVSDTAGRPIIIKDAQNQYLIPSILFDGRLFASQDTQDQETVKAIAQRLQNYANQISNIDAGLLEVSKVYYKPSRTMGYATFGIGGGRTIDLSLELSFSFKVYVDPAVYNTQTLLTTMTDTIFNVVNKAIQQPIISVSEITSTILSALGNNVSAVEGDDISGVEGLRLISLENTGTTPSIENRLSVQSDGSTTRSPNIEVVYLPKPDTTQSMVV